MSNLSTRLRLGSLLLVAALLAACSSAPKVRVDQDRRANFAAYHSFAWLQAKPADAAAEKTQAITLAEQRVRTSVTAALQARGYVMNEINPDVRVSSVLNVYERPKQSGMSIGLGAGGGSGNVGGGVGVSMPLGKRNETVASMAVNVIDAARNEQVWFGTSERVLKNTDAMDSDVQALTDIILAKYPVAGK